MDGGTDEFCGFIGALERQPKIGTTTEERDDLGHTYWSGIYMSVTLILTCMAIVVTVVGVKDGVRVRSGTGKPNRNK